MSHKLLNQVPARGGLEVIKKVKNEGYDGKEGNDTETDSQWNFSGSLLYSVTIITTIGK